MTYVIDSDRRLVDSFGSEMQFDDHADQALQILAKLKESA
jgi:peroxiredoxin